MSPGFLATSAALVWATSPLGASAQALLTGDARLACEAVLCLSTGAPPSPCAPALRRYFSISHRKLAQTLRQRQRFLAQCPAAQQSAPMAALVSAQAQAAGRCDAASLNASLRRSGGAGPEGVEVHDRLPGYCEAYLAHAYTDWANALPRYVGVPERGGYWVAARDHARAQRSYRARIEAEDLARMAANPG